MKAIEQVNHIVIHCTATIEGQDITAKEVHQWHLKRGFSGIGYHYLVRLDGTIEKGRPEYWQGAHVKSHNHNTIGVVYVGGLDKKRAPKDTRTKAQKNSLKGLLCDLLSKYPKADIKGHRDFSKDLNNNGVIEPFEFIKSCPCFDAIEEYEYLID